MLHLVILLLIPNNRYYFAGQPIYNRTGHLFSVCIKLKKCIKYNKISDSSSRPEMDKYIPSGPKREVWEGTSIVGLNVTDKITSYGAQGKSKIIKVI